MDRPQCSSCAGQNTWKEVQSSKACSHLRMPATNRRVLAGTRCLQHQQHQQKTLPHKQPKQMLQPCTPPSCCHCRAAHLF
jgi:hypothetical protein